MARVSTHWWEVLEQWSSWLFLLGGVFILVFALYNGLVYLTDTTFEFWVYPSVLIGRLAVLFGIAGLSVQVSNRSPRIGNLGRVVVALAAIFTTVLLTFSLLANVGVISGPGEGAHPITAVVGLGTVSLTIITYALFGVVILRTGAYSTLIGGLLLAATVALLGLFFGLMILPTRLAGSVGESILAILFFVVGYRLLTSSEQTERVAPASDRTAR